MASFTLKPSIIGDFRLAFPLYISVWERYPDLSDEEDEITDRVACRQMSELFAEMCRARGMRAALMEGRDAPWVDEHWWVRADLGGQIVNVDWTARQFYNLWHPPRPEHADLPCPFTWQDDGSYVVQPTPHPLVDFRTVSVLL